MDALEVPTSVVFEERDVPLWTFEQLSRLSRANLKQRALNLRDHVGAARAPPLRPGGGRDLLITWLLEVQVALANSVGLGLTLASFGAPADLWEDQPVEPMFAPRHNNGGGDAPSSGYNNPPQAPQLREREPPPYGRDDDVQSQRSDRRPMTPHEDAAAGALAARRRNEGSLSLAGDYSAPYQGLMQQPPFSRQITGEDNSRYDARPGTACSVQSFSTNISHQQAHEDSAVASERNRLRNQGSFAFG